MADSPVLDDVQRALMATFKRRDADTRHAFAIDDIVKDAAQHSGFAPERLSEAAERLLVHGLLERDGDTGIKITRQGFLCGVLDLCHILDETPPDPPL